MKLAIFVRDKAVKHTIANILGLVNNAGTRLHSYGFMDSAFIALVAFVLSQLLIIGLAYIPREKWRSAPLLARA